MNDDNLTLVLCGTGKTGRRVTERLAHRGVPTRVASRRSATPFDWEDQSTWAPALDGARAAYVAYHPDLAVPGAPEAVAAFGERANRSGVRRMVLLSGRGEPEAQRAEELLLRAAPHATIVRCAWFNQNFDEGYLASDITAGHLVLPAGDVGEPFVDANDIADVAVAALTDDAHAGELYELTGPRLLSFRDAARELSAALGRDVAYTQVSMAAFAEGAAQAQVPPVMIDLLTLLFVEVLDGRNAHTTDGVKRALGRPPTDFADYARDAAARGVWTAT